MLNILNKYGILLLIVVNIQLSAAQESKDAETKSQILCGKALPVRKNGKFILDAVPRSASFVCDDNFAPAWPPISSYFCKDGNWKISGLPECIPICDIENWNSSWTECVPDCGFKNYPDALLTLASDEQSDSFPHHVGIYFKFKSKNANDLKYVCGGSIISVRLVITAMYCVTLPKTKTAISLDMFDVFVAAGKFYNEYEAPLDINAQKRQVMKLEFKNYWDYFKDGAVLVIDEPFIFDTFVQPVCIDYGTQFSTKSYNGYVAGWGDRKYKASTALNVRLVTGLYQYDEKYITSRKICTNADKGCDICVGDIGSGLVAARNVKGATKYFLRNIVNGNGLDKKNCGGTTTTQYTDFFQVAVFLFKKLETYPNVLIINGTSALNKPTSCRVPFISNGRLLISGKPYFSKKPIPNHSVVYIECNTDTYLYPLFPKYIICRDGKFNRRVPKCSRTCPLLKSDTVQFICEINGLITDCTSRSFEGTIATMLCIPDHSNQINEDQYASAICRDGVWNQPFLTCQPKCTTWYSEYSQVYIYQNIPNDPKGEYICGGSIISDNIILSAAQCFTNHSNGELLNLESFFLHPYLNKSETRKFLDVKIPQEYKGKLSNFTGNLALIKLDKPLLLNTTRIRIGCFEEPLHYLEELKHANFRNGRVFGKDQGRYINFLLYDENVDGVRLNGCPRLVWHDMIESILKLSGRYIYQVHKHLVKNEFKELFNGHYAITEAYNLTECIYDVTRDMETKDKFCAGKLFVQRIRSYIEGRNGVPVTITEEDTYSSICFNSPGAGYFTAENDGINVFLQGVASFHKLNIKCKEEEEKYLFTAVEKYQPFLKSGIEELSICKIPDIQNMNFTISERNYTINDPIPNYSIVRVKCLNNFQIFPPLLDFITCHNGSYGKKLPYCIQCGQIRQINLQDNSTDGATTIEIPWQVEIYHNKIYKCGGTLINSRIIITNSLCFSDTMEEFQITVGKQNIDDPNLDDFTQTQNPNKKQIKFLDEIALIILKDPFILTENVQPVCLDWNDEFGNQEMTSSQPGIGVSSTIQDADENIQKFSDIDSSEVFLQQYKKPLLPNYFSAITVKGPHTSCLQDMGSGIAIKNKDGVYFLRGVFTSISNESLTFCTFIKVSYYLSFIINVVESNEL